MSNARRMARAINVEDLRRMARRRLPRVVFDYLDGGADAEVTLGDNRRSWDQVLFRPRQAVRLPAVDTRTSVLGSDLAVPFLLAPVGYTRILHMAPRAGDNAPMALMQLVERSAPVAAEAAPEEKKAKKAEASKAAKAPKEDKLKAKAEKKGREKAAKEAKAAKAVEKKAAKKTGGVAKKKKAAPKKKKSSK